METEVIFNRIAEKLTTEEGASLGKMMRSPAIKVQGKVLAFFHRGAMTFKLDQHTDLFMAKFPGSSYLSPFKNKPPMKGWLNVPEEFSDNWESLAVEAMKTTESAA